MGVNSLPKTVTRQRRDCDRNPDPSAPESSTLTTRLPRKLEGETQNHNAVNRPIYLEPVEAHGAVGVAVGAGHAESVVDVERRVER